MSDVDYGPLSHLIGTWTGDKGVDWSPEKAGMNKNEYHETIVFSAVGEVENAESQVLAAIHYHQVVIDKSDGEAIHNETGYWIWDAENSTVIHSFTIPRGVCVIAGGKYEGKVDADGYSEIEVEALADSENWPISQAPFMSANAKTTKFQQKITIGKNKFSYDETTSVEIYGKVFEHTDQNELSPK